MNINSVLHSCEKKQCSTSNMLLPTHLSLLLLLLLSFLSLLLLLLLLLQLLLSSSSILC